MHRLYIVPALAINFVVILVPALLTVALAFFRWDGISAPVFNGLGNFRDLADDGVFWSALAQQPDLDRNIPRGPDRDGTARGHHAPGRASRTHVLPGHLFPAGHHRNGNYGACLARHDLQPRHRRLRPSSEVRISGNQPAVATLDGAVRRRDGRPLALVGFVDLWHWWGFLCVIFFAALRQVPQEQIEAAQARRGDLLADDALRPAARRYARRSR